MMLIIILETHDNQIPKLVSFTSCFDHINEFNIILINSFNLFKSIFKKTHLNALNIKGSFSGSNILC